jgi:hypothetical protein
MKIGYYCTLLMSRPIKYAFLGNSNVEIAQNSLPRLTLSDIMPILLNRYLEGHYLTFRTTQKESFAARRDGIGVQSQGHIWVVWFY